MQAFWNWKLFLAGFEGSRALKAEMLGEKRLLRGCVATL
jgi:hypothetical protein